jgi:hypothetical protein
MRVPKGRGTVEKRESEAFSKNSGLSGDSEDVPCLKDELHAMTNAAFLNLIGWEEDADANETGKAK